MRIWGLIIVVSGLLCTDISGQNYHWPMDAPPALTSTFGEYRGGRLHAAVDLKTWGKEGYPVTAVADGYVWRVRTSPWGYGRVVYIKLNNGLFALWAHLSGFSEQIEKFVRQEQDRHGQFSVNLYFRPDQLPVKRGDVVGYSGSTGIGVPHLHFELRDDKHHPINPLTNGFDVEDTLAPTISSVGLVPLDVQARINAGHDPVALSLVDRGKYVTHLDTVTIWGRVGVGVKVFDRANASELTNRLAPYKMRLLVDGDEVFEKTLGKFSYDVTHHGELAFDFYMSRRGLGRFHSLYHKAGNRLPFYGVSRVEKGVLYAGTEADSLGYALLPGIHRVQVIAEDVKGNRSEAVIYVRVAPDPMVDIVKAVWDDQSVQIEAKVVHARRVGFERSDDGGKTWKMVGKWRDVPSGLVRHTVPDAELIRVRVQGGDGKEAFQICAREDKATQLIGDITYFPTFALVQIEADDLLSRRPEVVVQYDRDKTKTLPVRQIGVRQYEAVVAFDRKYSGSVKVIASTAYLENTFELVQQTIRPLTGGEIRSDDGRVRARFEKNKVYKTLYGHVVVDTTGMDERVIGSPVMIYPDDVAFEEAELAFVYPPAYPEIDKLGIYEWNDRKGWVFVDMGRDSTLGAVTAKVKRFGRYALLVDQVPPEIGKVVPAQGAVLSTQTPKFLAEVKDVSSGIWREEDIVMAVDGQALIVEYDPEEDFIFATPRTPLGAGTHQLKVLVRDICGNEAEMIRTFRIQ